MNELLSSGRLSKRPCAFVCAVVMLFCSMSLYAKEVQSPDGVISVKLALESGRLSYEVFCQKKPMLEASPLGLETSIGSFSEGLEIVDTRISKIDEHYTLPHGKTSAVHYTANELTVCLKNKNDDTLDVIFRVSNRDVAFAYRISSPNKRRITIERERTGFKFPQSATAFVTQQAAWGGGWMGTKPSYEEGYMIDVPVGTKSHSRLGFTFPALFRLRGGGWALVSETGVTSRYAGTRLSDPTAEGLYTIAFPEKAENAGIGDATVSAALPLLTPWRTITVGQTLAPIVETTVATDVVKPLYEPSIDYQPGRTTWSWLVWQDPSMNVRDQRIFIDLAAELGYEYILIDALWDEEGRIGRGRMPEMVEYARSKNVKVILWYNSNGYWNDAPQTPRNRLHTSPRRHKEMAWLQSIGVKGLKVDFFGGDKQVTMKYYEDLLHDANLYGLMLNFHGCTLPRGWERLYPNFMTSEAVTSSENLIFSQGFANNEAFNSTVFPFVRNTVAAMDYGPVLLNKVFSRDQRRGSQRRTTDAFQLATAVLFQSPLQHFGITPNNLEEQPDYVIDFLKAVPAVWDEIRFVDGYPGKYVVLARRSGQRWYVAATHADREPREMTISLPWLKGKSLDLIYDKKDRTAGLQKITVEEDGSLRLAMEAGGGAVLVY